MAELEALRAVDFDWVMRLESVWQDIDYDVADLNRDIKEELLAEIESLQERRTSANLLGNIIVGGAGAGKTHFLCGLRKEASRKGYGFILVDLTDVRDFWETTLLGYLSSLQQPHPKGSNQIQLTLEWIIKRLAPSRDSRNYAGKFARASVKYLKKNTDRVIQGLTRRFPRKARAHHDVIRALFLLHSEDVHIANLGYSWLQGLSLEPSDKAAFGFLAGQQNPKEIVRGLSWVLSLRGPVILALDQLDSIVQQHHMLSEVKAEGDLADEQLASLSIIEGIGNGLSALVRSVAQRTAVVLTCFEATWSILQTKAIKSDTDSYHEPKPLSPFPRGETARKLIEARLQAAFSKRDVIPPYPSWPFQPAAFERTAGLFPRELLMLCDRHRRHCLRRKQVIELSDFDQVKKPEAPAGPGRWQELQAQFEAARAEAPLIKLLDEANEDELLAPLLQTACRCLVLETPPAGNIDAVVDVDFGGGKSYSPLHCRIRFIDRGKGDLEKHYCLRAIQKSHAVAFQARLKAAMTASGIDRKLRFRNLVVIRSTAPPSGRVTGELVEKFLKSGGRIAVPEPEELRTLWALHRMERRRLPDFDDWLQSRRPVSGLELMKKVRRVNQTAEDPSPAPSAGKPEKPRLEKRKKPAASAKTKTAAESGRCSGRGALFLGLREDSAAAHAAVAIDPRLIAKHVVVLAGSGSGKTVLVRRLVEEAALLGIPSILVDGANDLARMGDAWPEPPRDWSPDDARKAQAYHRNTQAVIWTPGREKGNPLSLEPLPDLAAVADDSDELTQAVGMSVEAFREHVAPGNSVAAKKKIGVLSAALENFALSGGAGLEDFLQFLSDLPSNATAGIGDAPKLAQQIADSIRAAVQTNPLLRQSGAALDPRVLFGDHGGSGRTRISVINCVGLPNLINQQLFLNQLAMTLFSWIKKHPCPEGRPVRGLLVIDEAKDFVPSIRSVPCKTSLLRLVAQARKYGLGLVFATQSPRDLDHNVITNCTTQYYGKASSPNAIDVIAEQLRLRGGGGGDIPKLDTGRFYVYSESLPAPQKIRVPMCLSHHPPNPLNESEVLQRAGASRRRLGPRSADQ